MFAQTGAILTYKDDHKSSNNILPHHKKRALLAHLYAFSTYVLINGKDVRIVKGGKEEKDQQDKDIRGKEEGSGRRKEFRR